MLTRRSVVRASLAAGLALPAIGRGIARTSLSLAH